MATTLSTLFVVCLALSCACAASINVPFVIPTIGGGSWLDDAGNGFGEPLNVRILNTCKRIIMLMIEQIVVSALSTPAVLTDTGIVNFARALGLCVLLFSLGPVRHPHL